jgi:MYXO-CTERM domain-containing protein
MRRLLIGSLVFAAAIAAGGVSEAHIALTYPPPRHTELKTGPCGVANSMRGDIITVLEPGAAVTVTWDETIQHPGHFRILFDEDGFDFPDYLTIDGPIPPDELCTPGTVTDGVHCLAENIPDLPNGGANYSYDITLPNSPCENCTLQVIQFMTDKFNDGLDNEFYYQCADLLLQGGAGGGSSTTTGTTTSSGSGSGSTTSSGSGSGGAGGDEGGGALPGGESGCGCRVAGDNAGTSSAAAAMALGLLAVALRRRRTVR